MRNPDRIYKVCYELANIWSKVPDWRLGQFMTNMELVLKMSKGKDPFFIEDDDYIEFMKQYFKDKDEEMKNA